MVGNRNAHTCIQAKTTPTQAWIITAEKNGFPKQMIWSYMQTKDMLMFVSSIWSYIDIKQSILILDFVATTSNTNPHTHIWAVLSYKWRHGLKYVICNAFTNCRWRRCRHSTTETLRKAGNIVELSEHLNKKNGLRTHYCGHTHLYTYVYV